MHSTALATDTQTYKGHTFKVAYYFDDIMGAPWEESDGHGIISGWERRDKRPGERILAEDGRAKLFYDVQATMRKAKKEEWNTAPCQWRTKGEQAAAAVEKDFQRMQAWARGDWHWVIVEVALLDKDGKETLHADSLGGVESDYVENILDALFEECLYEVEAKTYPVTECGI